MEKLKQFKYIIFIALIIFGVYFITNNYFENKIKFRAFEECLSVVSDSNSNWATRKDTINYCKKETY